MLPTRLGISSIWTLLRNKINNWNGILLTTSSVLMFGMVSHQMLWMSTGIWTLHFGEGCVTALKFFRLPRTELPFSCRKLEWYELPLVARERGCHLQVFHSSTRFRHRAELPWSRQSHWNNTQKEFLTRHLELLDLHALKCYKMKTELMKWLSRCSWTNAFFALMYCQKWDNLNWLVSITVY